MLDYVLIINFLLIISILQYY